MKLFLDFLYTHIKQLALLCFFLLLIFIFTLAFILLLQIDNDQKLIKNRLNQMSSKILQIEKKNFDFESNITEQQEMNKKLNDKILNIQNSNLSNAESIGQITLVSLVDPLEKFKIDFTPSLNNRLVALEISALAINAEISMRTTFFQIHYTNNKLSNSNLNTQDVINRPAQKMYAGFEVGLANKILAAGSDLEGWISFEIPEDARIVSFSFDNGIVSANLKMPPLID